jgi:UDP-N-acetylglucosamine 2-epimerase
VYGDVNSTVAAALVCSKLLIQVGHVEAGLRSRDRTMPEEINRLMTDQLAEVLFTPSSDGNENLDKEGIPSSKVHQRKRKRMRRMSPGRCSMPPASNPSRGYAEAALRNVRRVMSKQNEAGWFASCCLSDRWAPLTHTAGYALRGVVAAYEFIKDGRILVSARKAADGLLSALRPDGFPPGRLDRQWRGTVSWSCLTGTAQIAACWLLLYRATGEVRFRDAGLAANRYLRSTVRWEGPAEIRGAVKGSYPHQRVDHHIA